MRHVLIAGLAVSLLSVAGLRAQEPTLAVRAGHGEPVACLALSPDGKQLLTGHRDGFVQRGGFGPGIAPAGPFGGRQPGSRNRDADGNHSRFRFWDAATGRPVRGFSAAFGVRSLAYSSDGKMIVAGGMRVDVFDPASGKILHAGPDDLRGVASFSKNGKFIAAVHDDGARVWDIANGKVVGPYGGDVTTAILSADGKHLIWGDAGDVMIVDWAADKVIHKLPHAEQVTALCLSPDEKWLVTGCRDLSVRLWDMASGKKVRAFVGHQYPQNPQDAVPAGARTPRYLPGILSIGMTNDFVVTAGGDDAVIFWDRPSGTLLRRIDFHEPILCAALSEDGKWLATAEGQPIQNQGTEKRPRAADLKKTDPAETFGKGIVGPGNSTVRLWDARTAKPVRIFQRPKNDLSTLALSIDGKLLATAGPDETARIWSLTAGGQIAVLPGHDHGIGWLAFGGDGKWLATQEYDERRAECKSRVWDITKGKVVSEFEAAHRGVAISARADWLAYVTPGGDTALKWLELTSNKANFIGGAFSNPALSPDGNVLAVSAANFGNPEALAVSLFNVRTGQAIASLKGVRFSEPTFSHDGKWLADSGTIWDIETKTVLHSFRDGYCSALSGNKKRFAAGRYDGIAVWDLATRKRTSLFTGHNRDVGVSEIALGQDGKRLFSAGVDSSAIRLIDADTGNELCKLYAFFDGSWAVIDAKGHYDAANNGAVDFLFWVKDGEIQPLDRFRAGHYEPGLLKKYLGPLP